MAQLISSGVQMNLQGITAGYVAAVNPPISCTLMISTGSTAGPGLVQVPTYQTVYGVSVQLQALSGSDLRMLDGVNLQQTMRKAYVTGNVEGVDRQAIKGGDLLIVPPVPGFPTQTTWLVTMVAEHWADWSSFVVVLQNGS